MNIENIVANLVQKVEHRFYGKYRGLVVDNADPEQLGRLKIKVPSVLGEDVVTGWALPCVPYGGDVNQGFLFIPEVGAGVWVEFEEGDLEFPIWVGTFWSKPGGDSELPKPCKADGSDESSVQDPPTGKIIKTKKGHTIQLDDADNDQEMIRIVEAAHKHIITMDKEGISIQEGAKEIKITDKSGNTITMKSDGITVEDKNGNKITMDGSGMICEDKNGSEMVMSSSGTTIKSSQISIGDSASEPLVLGNQLKTALMNWVNTVFLTHMHTGNLGAPTTPPLPGAPLMLDLALSQTNKVK
ncbi:MAG: Phage-related baseplate assembly protein [Syntrophorhabdus sp. PtaU1.Bin002]|nr:MAG: Phage-related baseplate assembly protein [Syntrophorhabdus sp. PtaU1.Bin002]